MDEVIKCGERLQQKLQLYDHISGYGNVAAVSYAERGNTNGFTPCEQENSSSCADDSLHASVDAEDSIKFSPPLYRQRYDVVCNILNKANAVSVCDFGCAECRALAFFRSIQSAHRLVGVDIDRRLLVEYHHRLNPLISDYLFRRSSPLRIEVFHGSLLDYDSRLQGIDAVTLIEVIEHLYEEDLAQLPEALFGVLAPRVIVLTTPNADFNVLFPMRTGFRHPDHKFEWTRDQFQTWCNSVAVMYKYDVAFGGIGDPPADRSSVGHCSQYAVFNRRLVEVDGAALCSLTGRDVDVTPYELIHVVDYPVEQCPATPDEKVLNEARYYINMLARSRRYSYDDDDDDEAVEKDDSCHFPDDCSSTTVNLSTLLTFSRLQTACNNDIDFLRRVLQSAGYTLSTDNCSVIYRSVSRSESDEEPDDNDEDFIKPSVAPAENLDIHVEDEQWD